MEMAATDTLVIPVSCSTEQANKYLRDTLRVQTALERVMRLWRHFPRNRRTPKDVAVNLGIRPQQNVYRPKCRNDGNFHRSVQRMPRLIACLTPQIRLLKASFVQTKCACAQSGTRRLCACSNWTPIMIRFIVNGDMEPTNKCGSTVPMRCRGRQHRPLRLN